MRLGQVEDKDAVDPAFGCGDEGGPDALVVGVVLIGGKGGPVGEVDGEAVQVAALDLLGAFAAAGVDGEDAGQLALDRRKVGEDRGDLRLRSPRGGL